MLTTLTKTAAALTIAAATILTPANAEEAPATQDFTAFLEHMTEANSAKLAEMVEQKTSAILVVEMANLETADTIRMAEANTSYGSELNVVYASVPAYLLVPIAD